MFVLLPQNTEDYLDAYHDNVELRYHRVEDILGAAPLPGLEARLVAAVLHL
jgi:hypothetical protein